MSPNSTSPRNFLQFAIGAITRGNLVGFNNSIKLAQESNQIDYDFSRRINQEVALSKNTAFIKALKEKDMLFPASQLFPFAYPSKNLAVIEYLMFELDYKLDDFDLKRIKENPADNFDLQVLALHDKQQLEKTMSPNQETNSAPDILKV